VVNCLEAEQDTLKTLQKCVMQLPCFLRRIAGSTLSVSRSRGNADLETNAARSDLELQSQRARSISFYKGEYSRRKRLRVFLRWIVSALRDEGDAAILSDLIQHDLRHGA
jgi:hypothetical protein